MRRIDPHALWIGHSGECRDVRLLRRSHIAAVVDLALNESPAVLAHDMAYARFPLVDGVRNPRWLIAAAIDTTASLLVSRTPTLVACGAGMSRSPAVAAGAIALVTGRDPAECLQAVIRGAPADISPAVWDDVLSVVASRRLLDELRDFGDNPPG
jgi:hypothetical protein